MFFTLLNLRLSIFTATFMTGWERLSPYAVPSTTFPKAPEPRIRPVTDNRTLISICKVSHLHRYGQCFGWKLAEAVLTLKIYTNIIPPYSIFSTTTPQKNTRLNTKQGHVNQVHCPDKLEAGNPQDLFSLPLRGIILGRYFRYSCWNVASPYKNQINYENTECDLFHNRRDH